MTLALDHTAGEQSPVGKSPRSREGMSRLVPHATSGKSSGAKTEQRGLASQRLGQERRRNRRGWTEKELDAWVQAAKKWSTRKSSEVDGLGQKAANHSQASTEITGQRQSAFLLPPWGEVMKLGGWGADQCQVPKGQWTVHHSEEKDCWRMKASQRKESLSNKCPSTLVKAPGSSHT